MEVSFVNLFSQYKSMAWPQPDLGSGNSATQRPVFAITCLSNLIALACVYSQQDAFMQSVLDLS